MKRFIVDRIENDKTVLECENGEFVNLSIKELPKNIKEGDVLVFEEGSCFLDENETKSREHKIKNMMNSLFED